MIIGVPKEIKNHEYRVGLTPASVHELTADGHHALIESEAGVGVGFSNEDYQAAGADIVGSAQSIFDRAELIVKVKEPQPNECQMLNSGQTLFTFLHLAPDPQQARLLLESGSSCIAYETVTNDRGALPLLAPMSEVAGRLSTQAGAHHLEKANGGSGVLLGGVPGVAPAEVLILGGGFVGTNAAKIAVGMGADVTILDRSLTRLRELDDLFERRVRTVYSTEEAIEKYVSHADLVIGAVLVPGGSTPRLLRREYLGRMRDGSVVVDVAIDQGGCFETSQPTTQQSPTFVVDGVIHYCVTNIPGAVPRTSTLALNNATLPFILTIANKGTRKALLDDANLMNGLNIHAGHVVHQAVADALGLPYADARNLLVT